MTLIRFAAVAAGLALLLPMAAQAQDAAEEESTGAWEIDGELGVFSDYRFRGVSLSGKDPEVTAELAVAHESGFYVGTWLSNVDLGSGADDLEVDLYAGFATDLGGLSVDVGGIYYLYPSDGSLDYIELTGSLGTTVGPADLSVGVAYAPSQGALGNTDNTYVYVSGEVPLGERASLHGTFGLEDGAFATNKKDWAIGVSIDVGSGFTISGDYVDTAHGFSPMADATAVFSITKSF
ncbi:MAG: TorF family putative porin [Alteraurantiacibacter sp.]